MALIKPPRLTPAAQEKLTPQEQEELKNFMVAEMLTNITNFFKRTPIVTLAGRGGVYETVESYLETNHPNHNE